MSTLSGAGASPYNIAGNLNFGSAPESPFGGDISGAYTSAYNSALSLNQQNYSNILQGYQQTAGNLSQTSQGAYGLLNQANTNQNQNQAGIQAGYGQLSGQVQNTIQGIGASQSQAIQDTYAQQSGQVAQSLNNAGLGNTTVSQQMQRGPQLDAQKAQIALQNQLAQLSAGYQSQLGLAGLGYANTANQQSTAQANLMAQSANQYGMQNAQQANQQLGFQNSVQAPYPNGQTYAQLLQNQGALGIAQQQLALAKQNSARNQAPGSLAPPMYAPAGNTMSPYAQSGITGQGQMAASPQSYYQPATQTSYTGSSGFDNYGGTAYDNITAQDQQNWLGGGYDMEADYAEG